MVLTWPSTVFASTAWDLLDTALRMLKEQLDD